MLHTKSLKKKKLTKRQQLNEAVYQLVDLSKPISAVVDAFLKLQDTQTIMKRTPDGLYNELVKSYSRKFVEWYCSMEVMPQTAGYYKDMYERKMDWLREQLNLCRAYRWHIHETALFAPIRLAKKKIQDHFLDVNPDVKEADALLRAIVIMSKRGVENEYMKKRLFELTDNMVAEKVVRLPCVEDRIAIREAWLLDENPKKHHREFTRRGIKYDRKIGI
jgi:hypothetical protein